VDSRETILQSARGRSVEPTVALNPLTGLHWEDVRDTARDVALQGMRQPFIFTRHAANHTRKLVDIVSRRTIYTPDKKDPRFRDGAWRESAWHRTLMQSYLALLESLEEWREDLDLDEIDNLRADFLLRLLGDSMSPSNNLLGNPEALRKARETRGGSLLRGAANLLRDWRHNHGIPAQVARDRFVLGKNIANTPGKVVFSNEVLELIQYQPRTRQVSARPLLMVSAMINKYYALDLSPERSFIRYCLDRGLQVFVVSWANPQREQAHWGIETYALAVHEAMAVVKSISRSPDLNLFALCSGAMAMSALAAWLAAEGDDSIHSLSVGVCMLEMAAHDMEIAAFANEETYQRVKARSAKAGILRGHELAVSMLWLRPQDLIWSKVVNNYLLGNEPPEFDLLHWNNDWTNLPAALHADVIDMFRTGCLLEPGEMQMQGRGLNLDAVQCDQFFVGGLTDHITPWKACYRTARGFSGKREFVLSNSGHMQTLLNAPGKRNACFFTNSDMPESADDWVAGAQLQQGSWWNHWFDWISKRSGVRKSAPRRFGNRQYPAGIDAPGSYALQGSERKS
jgi:polyhydroxyalkanoate synthase